MGKNILSPQNYPLKNEENEENEKKVLDTIQISIIRILWPETLKRLFDNDFWFEKVMLDQFVCNGHKNIFILDWKIVNFQFQSSVTVSWWGSTYTSTYVLMYSWLPNKSRPYAYLFWKIFPCLRSYSGAYV